MSIMEGLRPQEALHYFEELCAIPHGSRDTKRISDYCVRFAREHGLRYVQDEHNNVVIYKNGTPGYEDHPTVILQGHLDMVCEKDADCDIDFSKDGLRLRHDGKFIFAEGTTLGGDDGIAVAYALAVLAATDLKHPPLEAVFTVDEEIGMLGADAMDMSVLRGRVLLNCDSEDEGILTVSCAGGATSRLTLPIGREACSGRIRRMAVRNLTGGHSGVEINKGRANANKVLAAILEKLPVRLISIDGGSKDNAIPHSCQANVVAMGIGLERINTIAAELQAELREKYDEPELVVQAFDVDALGGNSLTTEDTARAVALLCAVPNGVQSYSADIPGLVQTSLNLGVAKLGEQFSLTFSVRSSVNQEKEELLKKLRELCAFYDGSYSQMGEYPAWEYRKDSPLRDTMVKLYTQMYGKEPEVVAIHAGLECGLLAQKLPGLDCVSIGPQMHDIHTSREKLEIASTRRVWDFLCAVLKEL